MLSGGAPTLLRLVAGRVVLFGLAAMLLQAAAVVSEYWRDDEGLARLLAEMETAALAEGIARAGGATAYQLPPPLATRYAQTLTDRDGGDHAEGTGREGEEEIADGYYARVRTRSGTVLFSNCGEECTEHFLPLTVNPPAFWQRPIGAGKPLSFAGGRTVEVGGETFHVELAVVRDPSRLVGRVVLHEIVDHMVVPMTLMLTLVVGATIWSLRAALAPVEAAAVSAERIDPRKGGARIATAGMPREIALFAQAVNRSLDRIGELIRSQRLFATAIAHEIRTPAAIVRMELEHIDDPRALKALGDLDHLTHVLEQLTSLARLEAVDAAAFRPLDLAAAGESAVAAMAPLVYARGKTIAFVDRGASVVTAVPALVETVLRNLVDNAVRHTPTGTAITVTAGPGAMLTVADDGPGLHRGKASRAAQRAGDGLGVGLEIVARIAALHGAMIERPADAAGGVVAIRFPEQDRWTEGSGVEPAGA